MHSCVLKLQHAFRRPSMAKRMAPMASQHAVQQRRPMLLPPPLFEKSSAAKPPSVRGPQAAANARVAPSKNAAAATYTAAAYHSCHRQQQPRTEEASESARTLRAHCTLTSMFRVSQRTNRTRTPMPPPAGIPCRCISPACRAVCRRFPPGPHGRVSHHAAETHCDRLVEHETNLFT